MKVENPYIIESTKGLFVQHRGGYDDPPYTFTKRIDKATRFKGFENAFEYMEDFEIKDSRVKELTVKDPTIEKIYEKALRLILAVYPYDSEVLNICETALEHDEHAINEMETYYLKPKKEKE